MSKKLIIILCTLIILLSFCACTTGVTNQQLSTVVSSTENSVSTIETSTNSVEYSDVSVNTIETSTNSAEYTDVSADTIETSTNSIEYTDVSVNTIETSTNSVENSDITDSEMTSVATEPTEVTELQKIRYGICISDTIVRSESNGDFHLAQGQKIGIIKIQEDILIIQWYRQTASVDADSIKIFPENYCPDFNKGRWEGCITP